jgi:aryl sulfotransferase
VHVHFGWVHEGWSCSCLFALGVEMSQEIKWPVKMGELHNHHFDSTMWNDFKFRDDDIIISTYAKAGTTWMQQIVAQLMFEGDPELAVAEMSPWVDLRIPPKEVKLPMIESQTHRRFMKTHLPVEALCFSPQAKYIYIGRDGRDVVWSLYNHHINANQKWYEALNESPGRVGPPIERPPEDIRQYWEDWLRKDGYPFWPFWDNVRSWWEVRELPNVKMVHYSDLKRDMASVIRSIARFLEIPVNESRWEVILECCSFDWMKKNATKSVPLGGAFWDAGAQTFIHKGVNGRWESTLLQRECVEYEKLAVEKLGEECARWLSSGEATK